MIVVVEAVVVTYPFCPAFRLAAASTIDSEEVTASFELRVMETVV